MNCQTTTQQPQEPDLAQPASFDSLQPAHADGLRSKGRSRGTLRSHTHTLSAEPLWRQTWKGPVLSGVTAASSSSDGRLLALGFSLNAKVELWDVSSYPCPMTVLELPSASILAKHFESYLLKWSHRGSSITSVYKLKSSSKRINLPSNYHAMSLMIQWDLHSLRMVHSIW